MSSRHSNFDYRDGCRRITNEWYGIFREEVSVLRANAAVAGQHLLDWTRGHGVGEFEGAAVAVSVVGFRFGGHGGGRRQEAGLSDMISEKTLVLWQVYGDSRRGYATRCSWRRRLDVKRPPELAHRVLR